ncbi:hypothetical protein M404DRAFT_26956 [Pisolithus tinctorius Marx 270]|uniref:Uncharacterized protein n=1 Tax=Pisolithus tinctorius Marx 270 TaxID=870435 RepID=A0A0C3P849_PISTI|nr:hypothetical protein M404DRAFT_26956 [Pisolithus tinctorius Marx 270]
MPNIIGGQRQGPTIQAKHGYVCSIVVFQGDRWMFAERSSSILGVDITNDCTKTAFVDSNSAQIFGTASSKRLFPPLPHPHVVGVRFSPDGN